MQQIGPLGVFRKVHTQAQSPTSRSLSSWSMAASAFWRLQRLRHQRPPSASSDPFPPSSSAASSACAAQQCFCASRYWYLSSLLACTCNLFPQVRFYSRATGSASPTWATCFLQQFGGTGKHAGTHASFKSPLNTNTDVPNDFFAPQILGGSIHEC